MRKKITYIITLVAVSLAAFSIGKFTEKSAEPEEKEADQEIKSIETTEYGMLITFGDNTGVFVDTESLEKAGLININEIKGWEHWDDGKIAGIELQADDWIYEITKVPYTVDTTVTKTE